MTSDNNDKNTAPPTIRRAAAYVRMSTDNQKYSIDNQMAAITRYAEKHHIEIVSHYTDGGKSGLNIKGRKALQKLISDVQTRKMDFSVILVLDVTRWGRFQNMDEPGYYEFTCRMKAMRQIEAATLMNDANVYSFSYIQALVIATPKAQLVNEKAKKVKGLDEEQIARMESEMGSLKGEYRLIEESFGPNVLTLTIARTYLSTLLENVRVIKYLAQHYPEYLTEFQKITDMASLGGGDAAS